jgi:Bacterial protein of unknown function (DUF922)
MGGARIPGPIGTDPSQTNGNFRPGALSAGFDFPGPISVSTDPRVGTVVVDWHPPNPTTTPAIIVRGATLADVAADLDTHGEWGQGGGSLRFAPLENITDKEFTVHLHGNLLLLLPEWVGLENKSPAVQAEWNRMLGKLRAHEQRHVDIAIEEGDRLAKLLKGKEITKIAALVTAANATMNRRQNALDADTAGGTRPGVPYGDISLDVSIK